MKNERYYYGIMKVEEKKAYKLIYEGISVHALEIPIDLYLSVEEVQEIYLKVLYDNPLFYFINQTVIRMVGNIGRYVLLPEYIYSDDEILHLNQEIRRVVDKVAIKAKTLAHNEFRLEKFLHDCVVKSVAYDYDSLKRSDCFNAHSIIGAFLDHKAVCEGIAKAFKLLCNEFSLKCIVVLGKASADGIYTEDCYHAWNLVKVEDESYYVDVTWDNMYEAGIQHISYDYFNVTTKMIQKDHEPIMPLPYCDSTRLNYFYYTNSIVSTRKALVELVEHRIQDAQIMFMIDTRQGEFYTELEVKDKTIKALQKAFEQHQLERGFLWMYNKMQGIAKVIFTEAYK